jgi:hypothetical protein
MEIRYLCIDGASSSSRSEADRLETIVHSITGRIPNVIEHSFLKSRTKHKLDEFFKIASPAFSVVVICKSQGAWRVLDYLQRNRNRLDGFDIRVVSIDPHHWAGSLVRRNPAAVFNTVNIYQQNEWPCGFEVINANNIILRDVTIDHWNIIHHPAVRAAIIRQSND